MFYDKLVGIKYGTRDEAKPTNDGSSSSSISSRSLTKEPPKLEAQLGVSTNGGNSPTASPSRAPAASPSPPSSPSAAKKAASSADVNVDADADADAASAAPAKEIASEAAGSPDAAATAGGADPMDVTSASEAATSSAAAVTPTAAATVPAESPSRDVKPEAASGGVEGEETKPAAGEGGGGRGGPFRVSMRLSNEMPEFMVVASKYDEATTFPWRSEMHIQMAFMEEPGMVTGARDEKGGGSLVLGFVVLARCHANGGRLPALSCFMSA